MAAPAIGIRPRWAPAGRPMVVDPNHPLSRGLWFHRSSADPGRSVGGADLSWDASPFGRTAKSAASATCAVGVPIPNIPGGSLLDWSFHTVKAQTANDAWQAAVSVPISPQSGTWTDPYLAVAFTADASGTVPRFHATTAGTAWTSVELAGAMWLNDGLWHSYSGSWGTQGAIAYRDGQQYATSATTPNGASPCSPVINGTPEVVFLGRSVGTVGEGVTGRQPLAIMWTRRLSAVEVAMVHCDPYCMLMR